MTNHHQQGQVMEEEEMEEEMMGHQCLIYLETMEEVAEVKMELNHLELQQHQKGQPRPAMLRSPSPRDDLAGERVWDDAAVPQRFDLTRE